MNSISLDYYRCMDCQESLLLATCISLVVQMQVTHIYLPSTVRITIQAKQDTVISILLNQLMTEEDIARSNQGMH